MKLAPSNLKPPALISILILVISTLAVATPANSAPAVLLDDTFTSTAGGGVGYDATQWEVGADGAGDGVMVTDPNDASKKRLQLTSSENLNSRGYALFQTPLPTGSGLDIEFKAALFGYKGDCFNGGTGYNPTCGADTQADGLVFYFKDGANTDTGTSSLGFSGGALGYSSAYTVNASGLSGGLLGIGFDAWGNFYQKPFASSDCTNDPSQSPSLYYPRKSLVLRGSQGATRTSGYCRISSTNTRYLSTDNSTIDNTNDTGDRDIGLSIATTGIFETAGATIRITVDPQDTNSGLFPRGTGKIYISNSVTGHNWAGIASLTEFELPEKLVNAKSFKFGFVAGTGAGTENAHVWDARITTLRTLPTVNISYNAVGGSIGSGYANYSINSGAALTTPTGTITKAGNVLLGWSRSRTGSIIDFTTSNYAFENTTLYAQWDLDCAEEPVSISDTGSAVWKFTKNCQWVPPAGVTTVSIIAVGGGGGGAGGCVSGGGGGGGIFGQNGIVIATSLAIQIGEGGLGANAVGCNSENGQTGGNTMVTNGATNYVAYGGGGGSRYRTATDTNPVAGLNGGSGGGSAGNTSGTTGAGGTGVSGQGLDGGKGFGTADYSAGGGGGYLTAGGDGTSTTGGAGGNGLDLVAASIFLTELPVGAGGGGGSDGTKGLGGSTCGARKCGGNGSQGASAPQNAVGYGNGGGGASGGNAGGNGSAGVLYIRYTIPIFNYSISFSMGTGNSGSITAMSGTTSDTVTISAFSSGNMLKTGYHFNGWLGHNGSTTYTDAQTLSLSGDFNETLTAQWAADSHNVTFDSHGGSSIPSSTFLTDGTVSNPGNPSLANFTFAGWFVGASGGSPLTFPYTPGVITDITLHAQWTAVTSGGGGSGGGSGGSTNNSAPAPAPSPEPIVPKYPEVDWSPQDMYLGDLLSSYQLNADFSVPGKATYSLPRGYKPKLGSFELTVSFQPLDSQRYYSLSVTKTIKVSKFEVMQSPKPSPSATPTPEEVQEVNVSAPKTLKLIAIIKFHTNDYFLDPYDRKTIIAARQKAKDLGAAQVIVKGNTDVMKGLDNMVLSKQRALAVSKYIKSKDFKPMVVSAWYSYFKPVASGKSQKALAQNRRVEIYAKY